MDSAVQVFDDFTLTPEEELEVLKLAAVGLRPHVIAAALEFTPERRRAFVALAAQPGSPVALLLESGEALGVAAPWKKLQEVAETGNVEAVKALREVQAVNRFNSLLLSLDDDEL